MLPLVSIVTPSFNQGRFLRRAIDSVLGQDYPRIEYLVYDGGSSDDSVDILRSHGDRFFWQSQPDRGQSDAINQGFRRAKGDILAWLNSDDALLPGAVSNAVAHFRKSADCDLIYGNAHFIDENDRLLGNYPTAPYAFERMLQSCNICQPAAFWRRSVFDRIGALDESLHYAMDYDYWFRLDRAGGKLLHVPEYLACSRVHPETKTQSARLQCYREILAVSRRHAPDASFSQYYAYWRHRCHERATGWPRWLRFWPECHWWLAYAHRRLFRAARKSRQGSLRA